MFRPLSYALILMVSFASCKVNQSVNGVKHGKWITGAGTTDDKVKELQKKGKRSAFDLDKGYVFYGRYNKGRETGTWKYKMDGQLVRKEVYRDSIALVTFYHPNQAVSSTGITRLEILPGESHWYYTGNWEYFNDKGKLVMTRTYVKGTPVNETEYGN